MSVKKLDFYCIGEVTTQMVNDLMLDIGEIHDSEVDITLYISAWGDDQNQPIAGAFYDWLRFKDISLTTIAMGTIQGPAIWLFLAGKKRKSLPHANFVLPATVWYLDILRSETSCLSKDERLGVKKFSSKAAVGVGIVTEGLE